MLDRPRCLLVAHQGPEDREERIEDHLAELGELARSCGYAVLSRHRLKRGQVAPKTYYGPGQLEALAAEARRAGAKLLICDDELTGSR